MSSEFVVCNESKSFIVILRIESEIHVLVEIPDNEHYWFTYMEAKTGELEQWTQNTFQYWKKIYNVVLPFPLFFSNDSFSFP